MVPCCKTNRSTYNVIVSVVILQEIYGVVENKVDSVRRNNASIPAIGTIGVNICFPSEVAGTHSPISMGYRGKKIACSVRKNRGRHASRCKQIAIRDIPIGSYC